MDTGGNGSERSFDGFRRQEKRRTGLVVLCICCVQGALIALVAHAITLGWEATEESYPCDFNSIVLEFGHRRTYRVDELPRQATGCGIPPRNTYTYATSWEYNSQAYNTSGLVEVISVCNGTCNTLLKYCKVAESQDAAWESTTTIFDDAMELPPIFTMRDPDCSFQLDLTRYAKLQGYKTCDVEMTASVRIICWLWGAGLLLCCMGCCTVSYSACSKHTSPDARYSQGVAACICGTAGFGSYAATAVLMGMTHFRHRNHDCEEFSSEYHDNIEHWFLWGLLVLSVSCVCMMGWRDERDEYRANANNRFGFAGGVLGGNQAVVGERSNPNDPDARRRLDPAYRAAFERSRMTQSQNGGDFGDRILDSIGGVGDLGVSAVGAGVHALADGPSPLDTMEGMAHDLESAANAVVARANHLGDNMLSEIADTLSGEMPDVGQAIADAGQAVGDLAGSMGDRIASATGELGEDVISFGQQAAAVGGGNFFDDGDDDRQMRRSPGL